ncbi:MAG: M16 family metallopeptidase [Verrucomicrobiales bacterium]
MNTFKVFSAVLALTIPALHAAAPPWAHEGSDLAPDATVAWGALENGMRYALMANNEPPDRVSMRLYVDAGSLMEEDDQQGLAHFTEHMAFNGTTHFPAGEMVEYFQRLGMAFGADTNAHTSFKETVYKLDLPRNDEKLLRESLQLLRDYADGLIFGEEEIDKERGVILSEKLSRDSVDYRTYVAKMKFNMPEARLSRRLPIGSEENIRKAPRQRFLDYYEKYYRPERMVLVVVGAIEAEGLEALVSEYFASLERAGDPVPDPDMGKLGARGVVAKFHPEAEASASWITLETKRAFSKGADSVRRRAAEMRLSLANRILTRRLEILKKQQGAPFLYSRASNSDTLDFVTGGSVQLASKPETWREALLVAEQELRRALEFGFTQAELAEAAANALQTYERRAQTAPTRKSRDLANAIVKTLGERKVFTNPVDELSRVRAELERVSAQECLDELRALWEGDNINVFVSGNIELGADAGAGTVLAAFEQSRRIAVSAPVEQETVPFAYPAAVVGGEIASSRLVEDLELTQVEFANGVRLNVRPTDFEKDTVYVTARIGGGRLVIPSANPGLGVFLDESFISGGLEAHSADDLKRIFAGRNVGVTFKLADDAFVLSGKTTGKDLQGQLELVAAYLTAPGFRPEAQDQFRRELDTLYQQLAHTPTGVLQNEVAAFVHGGDSRFGYPAQEALARRSQEEARAWAMPLLEKGFLEISVVGDVGKPGDVVELAARTIGNLPARRREKPAYTAERQMRFPGERGERTFSYVSEIPKSMVMVYWSTGDIWDIRRSRRMNVLASVMRDRMRLEIREKLGEAYSPYARSSMSDAFTDFGYLFASVESERAKGPHIAAILRSIGEDLKGGEITEDELERAVEPLLNMLREYRRNNTYWMQSVVQNSQEFPQRLEWARTIMDDYASITVEDLSKLAAEFLGEDRALSVLILSGE